ncbi:unnamed protein product [Phaedon cochleariae]|uniref:Uncharacterized protein n=1 Tax=Phaedon cochleariae TaxID=80249 RepID=A0A9P0DRX5_PHACE|nr:unnamed protein product [Phaedon cochleariae]
MNDTSKKSITSESKLSEYDRDPDFHKGTSKFEFPNGDRYDGEYCAHRSGVVWREGMGTYTTKDGQMYKGKWMDDKLVETEEVEISFTEDFQYYGNLSNNKLNGPALYSFHKNMNLLCDFSENKPIGNLLILDKKGREWRGKALDASALFLPEHIYFKSIPRDYGRGRPRERETPQKQREQLVDRVKEKSEKAAIDDVNKEKLRELEMKIFAKTKKTVSDLKFEQSDWYQQYQNFKRIYNEMQEIVKETGEESLNDSQKEWFRKYEEFKKKYLEIMAGRKHKEKNLSEYKLFELFNSDEYQNSCPPVSVFYPTRKSEEQFEKKQDESMDHKVEFSKTQT